MRLKQKIKMRKSIRCFYLIIATIMLVTSFANICKATLKNTTTTSKKEIYSYTNEFDYSYKVNLINNKYIDENTLDMGQTYITDLIKNIDLTLNYNYSGSENLKTEYKYKITGKLQAVYTKDGEEQKVWEKEENLLEETTGSEDTGCISINEDIQLNLKEQNNLVKEFEQEMNMALDATYTISLEIETTAKAENKNVVNKYVSPISIELGEKTTQINGENYKKDTEYVTAENEITENNEEYSINIGLLLVNIIILTVAIIVYRYIFTKTVVINRIKNDYRRELNRMLRLCQDRIVEVKDKVDIKQENIIDVKDFGEIIKVSEELFKPILYWESKEKDEAWFSVMSHEITYRFVFKK